MSHRISQDEAGLVRAAAPAVVVALPVAAGDEVEAGATLVVLESMKMETAVRAPSAGRVREVYRHRQRAGRCGCRTAALRPGRRERARPNRAAGPVPYPAAERGTHPRAEALARLGELRGLITGYDVSAGAGTHPAGGVRNPAGRPARATTPKWSRPNSNCWARSPTSASCPATVPRWTKKSSDESRPQPARILPFLPALPRRRSWRGCRQSFRDKLVRALRHYDVDDLEPGPELEDAVYRLFLALQRMENQVPVITALLGRWLSADDVASAPTTPWARFSSG